VATVSGTTVWRWLSQDAIRPWRHRSWIFPRDPDFAARAGDVLDLNAGRWRGRRPRSDEFVICADEKTSIQARARIHPTSPPAPGRSTRVEHEYQRRVFGRPARRQSMSATARAPLVRAGPGVSAWTALPERDRALLLWRVQGAVVKAELAALLSYGHRRIAQRRLRRLVDYGLLTGFWAANRQRPRGRYAYALTKLARAQLERLVWPLGKPKLDEGAIETVSPVIHQLATHDLFAAFLRAADPEAGSRNGHSSA
jgi:hypothetical protein